jgi:hypothetical protein
MSQISIYLLPKTFVFRNEHFQLVFKTKITSIKNPGTLQCMKHKALTYVEYRAVSGVFQNIDPHPLTARRVCTPPPPAFGAGGGHNRWVERG